MQDLAEVAAVNPATFRCSKSSPTGPAVWSNTKPEVALIRIFCGLINKRGLSTTKAWVNTLASLNMRN